MNALALLLCLSNARGANGRLQEAQTALIAAPAVVMSANLAALNHSQLSRCALQDFIAKKTHSLLLDQASISRQEVQNRRLLMSLAVMVIMHLEDPGKHTCVLQATTAKIHPDLFHVLLVHTTISMDKISHQTA